MLNRYLHRYPFTCLLIVVILLLSLLPIPEVKPLKGIPLIDKWTHMVMYGTLAMTFWLELRRAHDNRDGFRLLLCFAGPVVLGGALELAQAYLTPCRSGEWLDFVANTIGVCLGSAAAWAVVRLFPQIIRKQG